MKNLKILILISTVFVSNSHYSQVGIETINIHSSALLEFKENTTKGIILPQVTNTTVMNNVVGGTLIFDHSDSSIKYYDGTTWLHLTKPSGIVTSLNEGEELSASNGVIIGATTSTATGVLVLESVDKALILPKVVDPVNNVKSPISGMICYDPSAQVVCFYNGKVWNFWGKTTE